VENVSHDKFSGSIIEDEASLTNKVLAAMSGGASPRLFDVMAALVRHLHAFAREVHLTEEEFETGIDFLNRIGQATNDTHNEGMLFSDVLGFSTLVCLLNNGRNGATETASALLGPFWRMNSPHTPNGGSIVRSPTPGPTLFVECSIRDLQSRPVAGAEVDVWQASPVGLYENQDPSQTDMNLRGKFITDVEGRFSFRSVKPAGYPVPTHGPGGELLRAQNRHPYRPAHLHFLAYKRNYKTLITQVFVDGDERLQSDVAFGVTQHLIGNYQRHDEPRADRAADPPWYSLQYTFVMEPGTAKLPPPPIK
jgi:protocatechuate 3,4-dioxygenase beta subunit